MTFLNEEQLNSLNKESMAMIIKTLQGQIMLLDTTNKKLSVQLEAANKTTQKLLAQVEALTAQIRLSNQRHFGKSSEKAATIDGQMSLFDYYSELFNEAEVLKDDSKEPDIDEITISYKNPEIATSSLIAAILASKYGNHVPLDRQARSFKDNGINIATNALANWVINSSDTYLSLLYERMHKCIYDSKVLHVD